MQGSMIFFWGGYFFLLFPWAAGWGIRLHL